MRDHLSSLFIRLTCALVAGCAAVLLAACATVATPAADVPVAARIDTLLPADAVLLGEQHDAPEHHRIERESVDALIAGNRLAALALEMAEEGRSTTKLSTSATEAQAQAALE